jgi:serine/threonine protein kinase/tetratricopeptide (TPR) repeat protein
MIVSQPTTDPAISARPCRRKARRLPEFAMPADADSLILNPSDVDLIADDPCVAALQDYQAALETGRRPDRGPFLARVPGDAAATLAEAMDGLDFLFKAVSSARGSGSRATADGRPIPSQLGDFRIVREVGRGGMGVVYEAEQMSLGRRVALKVLPFAAAVDDRQLQRFKTEAQAAAHLHHTNVVPVFAVGADRGVHYYAMQFIDGRTVADLIRELRKNRKSASEPLPLDENGSVPSGTTIHQPAEAPACGSTAEQAALTTRAKLAASSGLPRPGPGYYKSLAKLITQAADALEYAHSMGVVHRDVKPANMLVDARANLWVADFGLAQFHGGEQTATGDVLGTLRYMSPEQAGGRRGTVDHRTDIYSLGISLYELASLKEAFSARERAELLRQILHDDPPKPRTHSREVPVELETVILKAIAKRPAERYATAQDLADDLRRFVDDKPVLARRPTARQIVAKWVRRHSALVATAVAATFVVGIVLCVAAARLWVKNQELADLQIQTESARQLALRNASQARAHAEVAERSTKQTLDVLQAVALDLADKRIAQDPAWGKQSEKFLDATLTTCAVLARGEDDQFERRIHAIDAGMTVACAFAVLGRGEKTKEAATQVLDWNRQLVMDYPRRWQYRFSLARCHRQFGLLLRRFGETKAAHEQFRLALEAWNDPGPMSPCPYEASETHDNLGDMCALQGDREEAERHYQIAIEFRKRDLPALLDFMQKDQHEKIFQLAIEHIRLAQVRAEAGDRSGTEKQYRLALEMTEPLAAKHPDVPRYALWDAQCRRCLGDLVELTDPKAACEHYRQTLKLLPPLVQRFPGMPGFRQLMADVHLALGTLAPAEGRPDEASAHFRAAQDLLSKLAADLPDGGPGPGMPGYNENSLAWFLTNCADPIFRDPARAVELARKSVARAPQQADNWNTLGGAYYRAGDPNRAVEALQKAIDLHGEGDDMDWLLMAAARWQLGQADSARDARSRANKWLEKHPGGLREEIVRMQHEVDDLMSRPVSPTKR